MKRSYRVRAWSKRDTSYLRRLAKAGRTSREAAKSLKRSWGAVRWKAAALRIRFEALGRAFSRKQRARYK